jgi:hypothetical protein
MNHASQPCCQVDLKLHDKSEKNECDQQRKFMGEAANEVIGADDEFSTSRHSFSVRRKRATSSVCSFSWTRIYGGPSHPFDWKFPSEPGDQ